MKGNKLKSHPLLVRFMLFVAIPLGVCAVAFFVHVKRGLPDADHYLQRGSDVRAARIQRDERGFVTATGKADADVFYAIGYAQAQDRLWQLELQRRLAQGRLSQILGGSALSQDVWMRTLNLYGAAESSWKALDPEAKASLVAYSEGVNAWIGENHSLPPEFLLLGIKPERWRPLDSLAWAKVFALNLGENMWDEISNYLVMGAFDDDQVQDILGKAFVGRRTNLSKGPDKLSALMDFRDDMEANAKIGGHYVGSNAWVISGKHTLAGGALLANDPHLGLKLPSLWYAAHLKGPRIDASGMMLAGLPIVVFGRNRDVAWGGTSMMADAQDLYVEEVNPGDPKQYSRNGHWLEFTERSERIEISPEFPAFLRKPRASVDIRIRGTVDGPVVSDAMGAADRPLTLRWTALDSGDKSYEAFFKANYAVDWNSFKDSFSDYVAPAMNLLYADRRGNIGSIGVGRVPVRRNGDGLIPVPSSDGENGWTGYVPFSEMPQRFNPDSGYLLNANNKPVDDGYPHFISANWAPSTRAERIKQLIERATAHGRRVTLQDVEAMQADERDASTQALKGYLARVSAENDKQKEALNYIKAWSGSMSKDSVGASIFTVWGRLLRKNVFLPKTNSFSGGKGERNAIDSAIARTTNDQLLDALTIHANRWCKAPKDGREDCRAVILKSLDAAIDELSRLNGNDMNDWRWGEVHETLYAHVPFSNFDSIAGLFERRIPSGGSPNTINVADANYHKAEKYQKTFGAGFRQIVQWSGAESAPPVHVYANSTGQSGNLFSPHYDDDIDAGNDMKFFEIGPDVKTSGNTGRTGR